ncbi:hypothetical protein MN608_09333 [Microdochium nivale]|nr:hypothetical protein MN608_09333 [Microdochium nivale]
MAWTDWMEQSEGWDPKSSSVYHHHASFVSVEGAIPPKVNRKLSELVEEAAQAFGITHENDSRSPNGHYVANFKLQWQADSKIETDVKLAEQWWEQRASLRTPG